MLSFEDQLIIYLYSYIPAFLLALFFWWMDRFEREPILLVVAAFLWGSFGAGLLSYFWNSFIHFGLQYLEQSQGNEMISAVVVAPFVEELTKGLFVLAVFKLGQVDNMTDGILLGIAVGLGFAAGENAYYALKMTYPLNGELAMWENLWFREIHTTLLHASATAVWGALIGYSRLVKSGAKIFTILNGFVLAMVTHGFWNFMATAAGYYSSRDNVVHLLMRAELFIIFGLLLSLFLYSVFTESRLIIQELLEESLNGIIPEEHVGFFASMVRHPAKYKLPRKTRPETYAKLGVALAFRKHEYRTNPTKTLLSEIQLLRSKLQIASEYQAETLNLHYGK